MTEKTYQLIKGKHITTDVFYNGKIINTKFWLQIIDDSGEEIATAKYLEYRIDSKFNFESDRFESDKYLLNTAENLHRPSDNISLESISVTLEDGKFIITDSDNASLHIELNDSDMWITDYGREVLGEYSENEDRVKSEEDDSLTFNDHSAELEDGELVITYPEDITTNYGPEILHGFVLMSPMDDPTMSGNHVAFNSNLNESTCPEYQFCDDII
ncbi:hypothetical protein [Wolbachia endosymbiont of Folsomia candida]|uniref:hypothetical protein n=1 Tax=Wolbachia endosymbiont of Folsomia candida TaxID=169402 RepID=UPI000AABF717|nr:hypothetical protein [Wolbachia endosymbiont of Folsomia candida]APR98729.1 hypothetical protein ASM33_05825 [Wolbachia endosymbiont of Folsomia candida]